MRGERGQGHAIFEEINNSQEYFKFDRRNQFKDLAAQQTPRRKDQRNSRTIIAKLLKLKAKAMS